VTRGTGAARVATDNRFLDHMLTTLARYSSLDIELRARGDLKHHLVEDVGIVIGQAVGSLVTPTITRYADRTVAMDDALVQVTIDLGGRPYYRGPIPSPLYDHWMRSFSDHAHATVHIRVIRGQDRHHAVEAAFKALGFALRDGLAESGSVMSTKGQVATR